MDLLDLFIDLRGSTMFQAQREIKFAGNRCYEVYTVVMLELLDHFRRTARIDRRKNLVGKFSVPCVFIIREDLPVLRFLNEQCFRFCLSPPRDYCIVRADRLCVHNAIETSFFGNV